MASYAPSHPPTGRRKMSANTLASALAAARKRNLPDVVPAQPLVVPVQPIRGGAQAAAIAARPPAVPVAAATPARLSDADALMIAIQRSARSVDDIMPRRRLLAAGTRAVGR